MTPMSIDTIGSQNGIAVTRIRMAAAMMPADEMVSPNMCNTALWMFRSVRPSSRSHHVIAPFRKMAAAAVIIIHCALTGCSTRRRSIASKKMKIVNVTSVPALMNAVSTPAR